MIVSVALAAALHTCAPAAAPDTMAAIVAVESGGWPYALHDNTLRRSYHPRTRDEALRIAQSAIRAAHSIDVGIAQVNSGNFAAFHVDASQMLDACANLRIGSTILANAYGTASGRYPDSRQALWHAIMAYNTGSVYAGERYVRAVVAAAAPSGAIVPSIAIVTSPAPAPILPPAQLVVQHSRAQQPSPPSARQAGLRVASRGDGPRSAGIVRTLGLQVDHRP